MNIIIREAVREDCKRMMELINELAVYERAGDEVTVPFDHFVETGFGPNPIWWAFVAEVDGGVVGFALYYKRYSTWKGSRLYLEDLLVTEKLRGKGIGKLLFDRLVNLARDQKYSGMMWQVLDWNEPAISFYKKYEGVNIDSGWLNCNLNF
ncbi:MAG TPA: GNAT family N-acetyltransferase [Ferruginibacter sp.]|nr:GNAT family N-acetyltransferase [Ferruginibacter sp.]